MDDGDEKMLMLSGSGILGYVLPLHFFQISSSPPLAFNMYFSYVNVLKMKCSLDQQLNNKFNGIRN